jgi:hypothetical protein
LRVTVKLREVIDKPAGQVFIVLLWIAIYACSTPFIGVWCCGYEHIKVVKIIVQNVNRNIRVIPNEGNATSLAPTRGGAVKRINTIGI